MKIVLSRKGFDSSSGGVPSPIFADGRIISLPIPDKTSRISYKDINSNGYDLGSIVNDLTDGRIKPDDRAHLDPDWEPSSLRRSRGWRPLFGQVKRAQSHLRNHNVGVGDVLLFFGLFREIVNNGGTLQFLPEASARHVIWGWLQIGEIVTVDERNEQHMQWASYHPHFGRDPDSTNTVYMASENLELPGLARGGVKGAGIITHHTPATQLTRPGSPYPSRWQLPGWFHPAEGKTPLSYHRKRERWQRRDEWTLLESVGRGQEFVLDCASIPHAAIWVNDLIATIQTTDI